MVCGRIDVDDQVDTVDVDSASSNVGSDEDGGAAVLETLENAGALVLSLAAVQRLRGDTERTEAIGDPVAAQLGTREHDGATAFASTDLGENEILLTPVDHEDVVIHGPDAGFAVLGGVLDVIGQELAYQ